MEDEEILECLEKNSNNKVVLDFTKKIFKKEYMGLPTWQKFYDEQIKIFGRKMK